MWFGRYSRRALGLEQSAVGEIEGAKSGGGVGVGWCVRGAGAVRVAINAQQ